MNNTINNPTYSMKFMFFGNIFMFAIIAVISVLFKYFFTVMIVLSTLCLSFLIMRYFINRREERKFNKIQQNKSKYVAFDAVKKKLITACKKLSIKTTYCNQLDQKIINNFSSNVCKVVEIYIDEEKDILTNKDKLTNLLNHYSNIESGYSLLKDHQILRSMLIQYPYSNKINWVILFNHVDKLVDTIKTLNIQDSQFTKLLFKYFFSADQDHPGYHDLCVLIDEFSSNQSLREFCLNHPEAFFNGLILARTHLLDDYKCLFKDLKDSLNNPESQELLNRSPELFFQFSLGQQLKSNAHSQVVKEFEEISKKTPEPLVPLNEFLNMTEEQRNLLKKQAKDYHKLQEEYTHLAKAAPKSFVSFTEFSSMNEEQRQLVKEHTRLAKIAPKPFVSLNEFLGMTEEQRQLVKEHTHLTEIAPKPFVSLNEFLGMNEEQRQLVIEYTRLVKIAPKPFVSFTEFSSMNKEQQLAFSQPKFNNVFKVYGIEKLSKHVKTKKGIELLYMIERLKEDQNRYLTNMSEEAIDDKFRVLDTNLTKLDDPSIQLFISNLIEEKHLFDRIGRCVFDHGFSWDHYLYPRAKEIAELYSLCINDFLDLESGKTLNFAFHEIMPPETTNELSYSAWVDYFDNGHSYSIKIKDLYLYMSGLDNEARVDYKVLPFDENGRSNLLTRFFLRKYEQCTFEIQESLFTWKYKTKIADSRLLPLLDLVDWSTVIESTDVFVRVLSFYYIYIHKIDVNKVAEYIKNGQSKSILTENEHKFVDQFGPYVSKENISTCEISLFDKKSTLLAKVRTNEENNQLSAG